MKINISELFIINKTKFRKTVFLLSLNIKFINDLLLFFSIKITHHKYLKSTTKQTFSKKSISLSYSEWVQLRVSEGKEPTLNTFNNSVPKLCIFPVSSCS